MQIHHPVPEAQARPGEDSAPWLWVVRDDQGREVDCGRTADQASALRHARRSALQRRGEHSIEVRDTAPGELGGIRRSPI